MSRDQMERLARVAYAAYVEARTYDLTSDNPFKGWMELDPKCQEAWISAIKLVDAKPIPEVGYATVKGLQKEWQDEWRYDELVR